MVVVSEPVLALVLVLHLGQVESLGTYQVVRQGDYLKECSCALLGVEEVAHLGALHQHYRHRLHHLRRLQIHP